MPFEASLEEVVKEAWANRPEVQEVALAEKIRRELVGVPRPTAGPA
jgi:hypothetical protein